MSRLAAAAAALIGLAVCAAGQVRAQAPSQAGPDRAVILITIDGMRGDYIGAADTYHLKLPTLRRLMRQGAVSEHTISVYPTLTGTIHTSLVTGVGAGKHGILGNNRFDPSVWEWERDSYDRQPPYLDYADIKVGTLWSAAYAKGLKTAALGDAGLTDRTTIVVTGDHGFLPMHTQLAINLPLAEAGLISRDAQGHPLWRAIIAPNRGLGSLYLKDPADTAAAAQARQALERYAQQYPRRFRIVERAELDRLGADRQAVFGIEPYPGYVLDARLAAPFAVAHDRAAGHGYSPEIAGMETGLIIAGAGARPGVILPLTNTIDIGPTIARLLGLSLPDADGQPIVGAFK